MYGRILRLYMHVSIVAAQQQQQPTTTTTKRWSGPTCALDSWSAAAWLPHLASWLPMACVLPALPENTLWAEVDPPGCAAPPCCGEGLELSADVTCVISCQEGFNQDDGGTYEYTCTGGVLQEPSPICTEASPFFVLVIFGLVSGGVWIFMAYATFVQGQKLVHERRFSAADTPETRARRKSSLRATGSLDKRVAGNVCAWLTRPGGCCVPDEPEDTRMYSAIGIVENRSWCQRFCAKLGGCFGLFDSCRAFKQWHVTQKNSSKCVKFVLRRQVAPKDVNEVLF